MRIHKPVLVLVALAFAAYAFAQKSGGSLRGSVLANLHKKPLNEAVITITANDLSGSRIILSDSAGNYQVHNLAPGTYSMTFEMEGYKTTGRSNMTIAEGTTLQVNIELVKGKNKDKDRIAGRERITLVGEKKEW